MSAAAPAPARAAATSPVVALWRFTRPHTIIGTTLSVLGLYVLAAEWAAAAPLYDLACTLVAAWCVNVFIVGVNQLTDVDIDRINKPFLPLASGELATATARRIVAVCAVVPVALGLTQGALETGAVLAGLAIGAAYSLPPLRLKRFPLVASLCITGVRAVVVNLGVALHFTDGSVPPGVWALTLFVVPFAFAIAVLKDVPDAEGDRRFRISTFTVRLGGRRVLRMGLGALVVAYAGMAVLGPLLLDDAQPVVLAGTHLAVLAVLLHAARGADPADPEAFTRFYMMVWKAFFLEYALVPLAFVL
ncbi:MAG TPA: homogentisate phytyltransferase [Solirubrobacteraceae bacterium]|nr:homogentisate phytyltransferase [Solirubrobacteraceae bacterium]